MNTKQLCLNLVYCETEKDVIKLLKYEGLWDDSSAWQYYGDNENNFATIGNQQSRPEAAIVEKIINSVDAVLMAECLKNGINPESPEAPISNVKALEEYFKIDNGKLTNITTSERRVLSERICLVASGNKSNPCYSIIDNGEGQTPKNMPNTLLSIGKSNKLRIPFVQGKFNMGGTGVFQFCGKNNLQFIISKRNPDIVRHEPIDDTSDFWGFTIVRREDPEHGVRSSFYRYLAPDREILSFSANDIPLLPGDYPNPYEKKFKWGTLIKLYEYQMPQYLKTNITLDFYYRLSSFLPSISLPIRLFERREGFTDKTPQITLNGLSVRLEENKRNILEDGFPTSGTANVLNQRMKIKIYAFKRNKSKNYTKEEGIVFTVNGQTHGFLTKAFFTRKAVNMHYLADSLLVIVDCTEFDGRSREDLFMNSRDRLRSGVIRAKIESQLSELLKNHQGLKALRERRRNEELENKIAESKPLEDVLKSILKKSPTLSKLFISGVRLPNPFKVIKAESQKLFQGVKFPTYFKLIKT